MTLKESDIFQYQSSFDDSSNEGIPHISSNTGPAKLFLRVILEDYHEGLPSHPNHQAQALVIPLIALRCEVIGVNNKLKFSKYVLITEVGGTINE